MSNIDYREIIAEPITGRFARGWHCLGLSTDFDQGIKPFNAFDKRFVVYRNSEGKAVVLDAYCPHMGADLSLGKIDGDGIRCAFHEWRWGDDGRCDDIPYADIIPKAACIKSWSTMEENGLLFVWHDTENLAPIAEQAIPKIPEVFSDAWSDWHLDQMTINTNCRELIDNMADAAHFASVHGSPVKQFTNIVDGHIFTQRLLSESERLAEGSEVYSEANYYGPAYMTTHMTGDLDGIPIESRLLVSHLPINHDSFELLFGVLVKRIDSLSEQQNDDMVAEYVNLAREAFYEDVEIWHTKVRVDNPLLCHRDGPVNVLRKWYQQFYQNRESITPESFPYKEYPLTLK